MNTPCSTGNNVLPWRIFYTLSYSIPTGVRTALGGRGAFKNKLNMQYKFIS
uniref:Uncharacterized protein n=1 Tax=Anguilla anguilla TaxID=7936 RepID=A0A0E9XBQ2_ANGAN